MKMAYLVITKVYIYLRDVKVDVIFVVSFIPSGKTALYISRFTLYNLKRNVACDLLKCLLLNNVKLKIITIKYL